MIDEVYSIAKRIRDAHSGEPPQVTLKKYLLLAPSKIGIRNVISLETNIISKTYITY